MLTGKHNCAMDEKGRISFPSRLREKMGETFMVTRWLDNCLVAFPQNEWERIAEILSEKSIVKTRDIKRFLYSGAIDATPDKQGRILISQELREHAGLEKDVVIIGVGSHAEIWSAGGWKNTTDKFDTAAIAQAMEALDF